MKTSFRSKVFSLDETEDKIALETSGFNEFHINKLLKTNVNQDEEGQNRRIMEARYEIERL